MRFLGIDQSFTSTGLVVLDDSGSLVHYQIVSSDPEYTDFKRTWDILTTINQVIVDFQVNCVAIEGLAMAMHGNATRSLAILQGVLATSILFNPPPGHCLHERPLEIVTPSRLKKFATGNGKAAKSDIIESLPADLREQWQREVKRSSRDDLADAYFLAMYLRQHHSQAKNYLAQCPRKPKIKAKKGNKTKGKAKDEAKSETKPKLRGKVKKGQKRVKVTIGLRPKWGNLRISAQARSAEIFDFAHPP